MMVRSIHLLYQNQPIILKNGVCFSYNNINITLGSTGITGCSGNTFLNTTPIYVVNSKIYQALIGSNYYIDPIPICGITGYTGCSGITEGLYKPGSVQSYSLLTNSDAYPLLMDIGKCNCAPSRLPVKSPAQIIPTNILCESLPFYIYIKDCFVYSISLDAKCYTSVCKMPYSIT